MGRIETFGPTAERLAKAQGDFVVGDDKQGTVENYNTKRDKYISTFLGMRLSSASHLLKKKMFLSYARKLGMGQCFHCGGEMDETTISIEHVTPWLYSENPAGTFFDVDNIRFSHKSCNSAAGRRPTKKYATSKERNLTKRRAALADPVCRARINERRRELRKERRGAR